MTWTNLSQNLKLRQIRISAELHCIGSYSKDHEAMQAECKSFKY